MPGQAEILSRHQPYARKAPFLTASTGRRATLRKEGTEEMLDGLAGYLAARA